ncbi:hypothetical protein FJV41_03650 [Myxococcus llanfairpwllgwyngyllgogerychwyrndrobwllllantysiliogogogochensis]|uniref:Lipoprotein n=1 Tax=Myxococcus llanfairpwllgwyngyllgogerychwyrndrobwllllantysiliogogogochensis TaxID=2590453 RepID=A0A540X838_9BACT|nr:ELWxxDGT repeat protein [Myxococcus llanfairpwllgwyngyllgogerychwyrndrobwllllantysiliogogogochensis]TQF17390.1 hypothetical protein FJV41_03650 [Myxococcus llanfairpwllgwyngyllgogerychwyrndrobwllllantysiliogogogochensis]
MRYRRRFLGMVCLLASCSSAPDSSEQAKEAVSPLVSTWEACSRTAVSLGVTAVEETPFSPPLAPGPTGLVFSVDDGVRGREPWVSNGVPGAGTRLLKDLVVGAASSDPRWFTRVGTQVFFAATDPVAGRELFATDGTTDGTRRVKDIWPGAVGSFPTELFAFKGLLYFTAGDPVHGRELWRSDGTSAGTFMVEDLEVGTEDSSPSQLTQGGDGALYFLRSALSTFTLLMRTEGGPGAVEVFRTPSDQGIPSPLTPVGRKLFFVEGGVHGGGGSHGRSGTLMVTDAGATPVMLGQFGMVGELAGVDGKLLFGASPHMAIEDMELWRSDGTPAGTTRVEDIRPGPEGSYPEHFAVLGNQLFFAANDGVYGVEPWDSDGTEQRTRLFGDLEAGAGSSFPSELTTLEDLLFFGASIRNRGAEPWVGDGVRISTVSLTEIAPGPLSSNPRNFTRSQDHAFFTAEDNSGVRRLYALLIRPDGGCPP